MLSVTGEEQSCVPVLSQKPSCFTRRRKSGPASKLVQGPLRPRTSPQTVESKKCRCLLQAIQAAHSLHSPATLMYLHMQLTQTNLPGVSYVDPEQCIITSLITLGP